MQRDRKRRQGKGRFAAGRAGSPVGSGRARRARVIEFPEGRRPKRSRTGAKSAVSSGGVGRRRVAVVLGAFTLASGLLMLRAVCINLSDAHGPNSYAGTGQQTALAAETAARRGDIVSADGRRLATSLDAARVIATPYQIEEPEKTAHSLQKVLSPYTHQSEKEIQNLLQARGSDGKLSGYSVVSTVPSGVAEKVSALNLRGVSFEPTTERLYPDGDLASPVIGHVSPYGEAFGGVEARYNKTLASGRDVRLTLDTAVQQKLQDTLAETVNKNGAKDAVGLVLRVKDGAVVALANYPSYNNNDFGSASAAEQRDRVLTDPYEPGSTLKSFTFSAALQTRAVSPNEVFNVPDNILVGDRVINDSIPHAPEAWTMYNILQQSSNVGTTRIAEATGGRTIYSYLERFGFGRKTGIDLWGENAGDLPPYDKWSGVSIGNIPIGQGLTVTPLQLAAGYSAIANGGYQVKPHVRAGTASPEHPKRLISARTSDIVRGMLQSVITDGTGHHARIPGYTVAGKTGTSQKVDPQTGTYGDRYYASFIGFAPASDPKYLALIVVDEPRASIWGETVAAPEFAQLMGFTLGYFNVPPDLPRSTR